MGRRRSVRGGGLSVEERAEAVVRLARELADLVDEFVTVTARLPRGVGLEVLFAAVTRELQRRGVLIPPS